VATEAFFHQDSRLLSPWAFEFVLEGELKRAVRSQNFLTLVVLEVRREWEGMAVSPDQESVSHMAQIVRSEVRDTDVIGHLDDGLLSVLLLGADGQSSLVAIERLVQHMDSYLFPTPLRISLGMACYPTEGEDAGALKQRALTNPLVSWRPGSQHAGTLH
jgi:hypothetical protein